MVNIKFRIVVTSRSLERVGGYSNGRSEVYALYHMVGHEYRGSDSKSQLWSQRLINVTEDGF